MSDTPTKSVLITGCSTGIGYCLAQGLKQNGYQVFASCRSKKDSQVLQQSGFHSPVIDLEDSKSISSGLNQVLEITGGKLYALINNGAYGQPGAAEDLNRNTLRRQFETNVFGTQELTNRVIPVMRQAGEGRIIQISSVLGFVCLKYRGAYNSSKYALEALTDTMRLELTGTGIQLSLIEPGPIKSDFRKNAYRMYKENIDFESSFHQSGYLGLENRLLSGKPAQFTLPAEAVLKSTVHALESRNPKIRYRVTTPTKIFAILKRLLPDRLMDRILEKN
jgi:short-subunit dehydrogenase